MQKRTVEQKRTPNGGGGPGLGPKQERQDLLEISHNSKLLSSEISLFPNAWEAEPAGTITLYQALLDIREGKYKERINRLRRLGKSQYDKEKPRLPALTFPGTFSYRNAKPENLNQATGFIIADLDHMTDTDEVFDLLSRDEYIWFAFRSPSGEGIKAGLRAEGIESDVDIKRFYQAIENYFKETYQLEIDPACKDICRLTFISCDPDLWINPDPCLFNIDAWIKPPKPPIQYDQPQTTGAGKTKYARKVLEFCCREIRDSQPGEMHNTRLRMSRLAGGYISYLDEDEIYNALEQAVNASATTDPKRALKTIQDGMKYGKVMPIEIPDIARSKPVDLPTNSKRTEPTRAISTEGEPGPRDWPENPIPLNLPNLPPFDSGDFPKTIWQMAKAISEATETPPELPAMLILPVIATAVQKKFEVESNPGYREPLCIWTLVALDSGNRKSSALNPVTEVLLEWEIQKAKEYEPIIREAARARAAKEARIKELEKRYSKSDDPEKRRGILAEINEIERNMPEIPAKPRLVAQDITPEKLVSLLSIHNEKITLFSSEGGIFEVIGGRYSNGIPNIDILLQAYSGDMVRVDRQNRSEYLQNPALSMGIAPQPEILRNMADKSGFRGRGLIARFLFCLPVSPLGYRTLKTRPIPAEARHSYNSTIRALLNLQTEPDPSGKPPAFAFSPEAYEFWIEFAREIESGMVEGGRFEHMRDFAGKLPGTAARIAGLFHCVNHAFDDPLRHSVDTATIANALSLADKLINHAIAAYDLQGQDPEIEAARKIKKWIEGRGLAVFTARDCHYALKGTFKKRSEIDPGLNILLERGYIRPAINEDQGKPGRPSEMFEVHPRISN